MLQNTTSEVWNKQNVAEEDFDLQNICNSRLGYTKSGSGAGMALQSFFRDMVFSEFPVEERALALHSPISLDVGYSCKWGMGPQYR